MSELLMQAMVEKLESIELLLKVGEGKEKDGEMTKVKEELQLLQKSIKSLPSQFLLASAKLGELSANIIRLSDQLQKPLNNRVEHKHELHKGFLISIGLFLVTLFLIWGLLNAYNDQKQFKVNDIKYRSLKTGGSISVLKIYSYIDSLYHVDPAGFRSKVELEEQQLMQQAEFLRLAGEKEKEAKELKSRAGR